MKIFNSDQIRSLDRATIENELISSLALMDRAGRAAFQWIYDQYIEKNRKFYVLCGKGNNGGDGLVIGRLLYTEGFSVELIVIQSTYYSPDQKVNLDKAIALDGLTIHFIEKITDLPSLKSNGILVDALLGNGIDRPVSGFYAELIDHINQYNLEVISIDIPSGLLPDQYSSGTKIQARHTLTFESPKLAMLFADNYKAVGQFTILPIGLDPQTKQSIEVNEFLLSSSDIQQIVRQRGVHDHKGTFGHALMIHGSYGKMGAAILAAGACLRSGIGLLTMHLPKCGYEIMQISVPEAMVHIDDHESIFTGIKKIDQYNAIGVGCGLGQNVLAANGLRDLLDSTKIPVVLDADALNMIAHEKKLLQHIPKNSILTPHPKEFERLFGKTDNGFQRLRLLQSKAKEFELNILLKGAFSVFTNSKGESFFNSTGNPGMATAGSGDVLTGIITGLLGQGYLPLEAGLLGMYVHGYAGDLAANNLGHESLIARDIINHLGHAFSDLKGKY